MADAAFKAHQAGEAGEEKINEANKDWKKPSSTIEISPEQIDGGPEVFVGKLLDEETDENLPIVKGVPEDKK